MSSRSADIDFTFTREVTVGATVDALAAAGWSLKEPLGISYVVNDNDMFDWQSTTSDRAQEVLTLLDAPENADYHVAVCVYHVRADTGGQLLFFPRRTACSFSPTINRRSLPGSPAFTDVGWYLHTLVPPLVAVGLEGYEARDIGF
ncbi:hypothetical protein [Streptomyces inhibens]|uniref:hypothetical protein n=1 Tax=Streptomyces inhibens TaxID=2293571 RepID=UPI001EE76178|nr:hypothetical protein [Streptomyces inhibens]UKY47413.1 hypothetical protein KI385_00120 [Streptomyces inhibens]UKY54985.1 hypothetical protein KI385_43770 [Streptomyces inhibens]